MKSDHRQAKEIFLEVCELAPHERGRRLERLCGDSSDLLQEVEELLAFHDRSTEETTAAMLDVLAAPAAGLVADPLPEIPNYRVLRLVGEGGMGAVYEARQEEPVERRVAIKLLKRGLDTRQIVGRFEAERQALALMDHPNIARVFDAGASRDGRPFFAMEYVEGTPITHYCDADRLGIDDRLRLFVTVCEAVQHAHQKGIIHRDLKPSNVLVERLDGRAAVKVIDFGIAKAVHARLKGEPVFTQLGQLLGTPHYMSPEQADRGGGLDVDTRSDVYSLGVLLYQLLTGGLPLGDDQLRSEGRPSGRTIDQEPTRPSLRVRLQEGGTKEVAESRGVKIATLSRKLRGELDWIVMKALERDRSRRYPSASELAADVERYLADQPVLAGPPSAMYRLRKFVERHRVGVASGLLVSVALVAGSIAATVGLVEARRAQAAARQEAATAEEVTRFLVDLFQVSDPDRARGDVVTAREILDRGVTRIDSELAEQPQVRGRLMEAMGQVYAGLGLYEPAERLLREALTQASREGEEGALDRASRMRWLANVLYDEGEYEEAEQLYRQVLAIREEILGPDDPLVANVLSSLGNLCWVTGRYRDAEELLLRTLQIKEAELGPDHPEVANSLNSLGAVHATLGDTDQALDLWQRALAIRERSLGPDHRLVAYTLNNIGLTLKGQGDYEAARDRFEQAAAVLENSLGPDHPDLAAALNNLAELDLETGEYPTARSLYERAIAIREAALGPEHPELARTLCNYGRVLLELGELEEARANFERSLEMRLQTLGAEHVDTGFGYFWLAYFEFRVDELDAAARDCQRAVAIVQAAAPEHPYLVGMLETYAAVLQDLGRSEEATAVATEAEALQAKLAGRP